MARKKGTGSVITVRKLKGLGDVTEPDTYMGASFPPIIGGTVAALVTIAVEMWIRPTSALQANLVKFAPWVGLLAASLVSAAMSVMVGRPAALSAFSGAFVVAGALSASDWAAKAMLASGGMAPNTGAVVAEYGGSRTGAVVPEYGPRRAGTGATGEIVMERHADRGYGAGTLGDGTGDYGETVQLRGAYGETIDVGNAKINKVFGTSAFGQFG